jgi:hypothetical protein
MRRIILLFSFCISTSLLAAQEISVPDMFALLDVPLTGIDTVMKQKGYKLMQQETDSVAHLRYYTNLQRTEKGPDWVRSLTYREISAGEIISRLVVYRTYRKKEYEDLLQWLLKNNFRTLKRDNMGVYIHTIYDDGRRRVLVKQSKQTLSGNTTVWAYELEIGK